VKSIFTLALNDLRLTVKDRPSIFWLVIMPLGFIVFFSGMNSGSGGSPVIALSVVDEDQSWLSSAFKEALAMEGFQTTELTPAAYDTLGAWRAIRIRHGFQDSIAANHQVPIYLNIHPDAGPEASLTAKMHIYRAIGQILVHLIETIRETDSESAAPDDPAFQARFAEVSARERLVDLETKTAGKGRAVPSGASHSLPANMTLFMLINTAIYGAVYLTQEKQDKILPRIATYPISRAQILIGKLLGRTLLGLVQALILLVGGKFILGIYTGNSPLALALVTLCLAMTVGAIALFWGAVLRRVEQASVIALVVSLFMGAIGGCWWPLEVVPRWMQQFGHISPAAWAMDGFNSVFSFGDGVAAVIVPCLVLLGYTVFFTLLGARLLRYSD
jgi:ABC-type multidrug transport system permease subunit